MFYSTVFNTNHISQQSNQTQKKSENTHNDGRSLVLLHFLTMVITSSLISTACHILCLCKEYWGETNLLNLPCHLRCTPSNICSQYAFISITLQSVVDVRCSTFWVKFRQLCSIFRNNADRHLDIIEYSPTGNDASFPSARTAVSFSLYGSLWAFCIPQKVAVHFTHILLSEYLVI